MSKPSFLTNSFGRRSLSIVTASLVLLIITMAEATPSQESGATDRQAALRRLVQSYVQTGREDYDRGYFEHALKTFRMAEGYQEYLTAAGREQLTAMTEKAQTALAQRKGTLETFQTVNHLIKRDRLVEARAGLKALATNEFLTVQQRAQITEVLAQIDTQIAEQEAHSQTVKDRRLSASETLEKIAEQIKTPSEQQNDPNMPIVRLYYNSMGLYRSGQWEKAREGLAEVAASGLIPPDMKKHIEGTLAEIDRVLPPKAAGQAVVAEKKPEIAPAIEPKGVSPEVAKPTLARPKLTQSEPTEEEASEEEIVSEEPAAPAAAEPNMTQPIMVTSPAASTGSEDGSHIEQVTRRRNIVRSHTEAVVNDAVTKARTHMGEGQFDKARTAIETAQFVVNENQIDLGEELFKAHSSRLQALAGEIAVKQSEQALKAEEEKRKAAAEAQRQFREQMEIDRQKRIAELMQNALEYQKQQRYEAALGQLESLLALDPQHDAALTLKDTLEDTIYFRKQLDVEKEAKRQKADILLKTTVSGIPHAEELTYPKDWREIVQKPTRQPDKPIGLDPVDANVYERLEKTVDLPNLTQGTTFAEVIRQLANSVEPPLQIQPNWKDLLELGEVEPATPGGMDPLTGVKVRKALEILLASVSSVVTELNYVVDEGVILIATKETLPDKMVTRVYEIPALAYSAGAARELVKAIQESIEPESWYGLSGLSHAGEATIGIYLGKKLAILQTPENHQKIQEFLTSMTKDSPVGIPSEAPTDMLMSEKYALLREKQSLEREIARLKARPPVIEEQITRTKEEIQERIKDDPVSDELKHILVLQREQLEAVKKLVKGGGSSSTEVAAAEEKIARTRIEIAQRRELLSKSAGSDQLVKFSNELATLIVDLAEKQAMLKVINDQLGQTEQELMVATISDLQVTRIRQATQILESADRRVNELNKSIFDLQSPMVSVIGVD